MASSRGTLM
jgi:protein transport protein SEC61 subunit alpha